MPNTPPTYAQIRVFTGPQALGNTSAVLFLDNEWEHGQRQQLARELAQPATTFIWPTGPETYGLRWHAPDAEIDLCGHGAVAAMAFLRELRKVEKAQLQYRHGAIEAAVDADREVITLDAINLLAESSAPEGLAEALGAPIQGYFPTTNKQVVLLDQEETVHKLQPNFAKMAELEPFAYAVTAEGEQEDFVSRTFVPKVGQLEDHATGSSHASLMPFWSERLGKRLLSARQLSPRGGYFRGEVEGNKVKLHSQSEIVIQGHWQSLP